MNLFKSGEAHWKPKLKASWGGPLVGVGAAVLVGMALLTTAIGEKLIFLSYDVPFLIRPAITPQEVQMVYLDEATFQALDQSQSEPLNRKYWAQLIRRMTKEKARAVVFDVVFSDPRPENPEGDKELIEAVKKNKKIVLAADFVAPPSVQVVKMNNQIIPPFPDLEEIAGAIGTAEMPADDDLVNRHHVDLSKEDPYPSLSWAAAEFVGARVTIGELNKYKRRWFNYYGPDKTLPYISLFQALQVDPNTPEGFFSNKVVFVGGKIFTVGYNDRKDAYPTPFPNQAQANKFMPGVEIQATEFLNLLRGDWLNRLSYIKERWLVIGLGILFGAGLALLRPIMAVRWAVISAILVFTGNYLAFVKLHYWFPWAIPVIGQIPIALAWSVAFNTVRLYVEKRLFEQTLGLYLSHKLVKKFANDPKLREPGAQKQLLTILFTDIAGFTSISEGMDPDDLARLMNQYFQGAVQNCIFPMEGTVVKYIGDAIFAFWNAPEPQADHAYRACEAALRLREQDKFSANGQPLLTRLGLHTGEANVGNFGSNARFDYTALGENINLASRMEGLNKYLGTRVLITAETKKAIDGRLVARYLGLFRLKGFEKAVGVYELMTRAGEEDGARELRVCFADALEKFARRDLAAAATAFSQALEIAPGDGPSQFYLDHMEEIRGVELPADWKGEITLKDK